MQKILFAIFAHPDDEAFGPSGALLMEARAGTEVHLITLTYGGSGTNPDQVDDLATVREKEWRQSGALIGATAMHGLGYTDGRLCNEDMAAIGQQLVTIIRTRLADASDDVEIECMTSDLNGISGHIDHIVAARAASWAFYTLKAEGLPLTRIRYACAPRAWLPEQNTNWLFMEAGRDESEIDEVVDARAHRDDIIAIMRAHHSQRADGESHIKHRADMIGMHYFIVRR